MVGVVAIFILLIYIFVAVFLNKFNKLVYGKGTAMSWVPIANIYLLGKLAVNQVVGWILIACIFLTAKYTITINDKQATYYLLPKDVNDIVSFMLSCLVFVLLIYGIKKYFDIKRMKEGSVNPEESNKK